MHAPSILVGTRSRACVLAIVCALAAAAAEDTRLERISFGSCNQHDLPQTIWPQILEGDPQLWIWSGDCVYTDTTDPSVMREIFEAQHDQPAYAQFRSQVPIIGVWDDHDFGDNNGGAENKARRAAQQAYLDFLDEPADSPRRQQEGVYAAYDFGPAGSRVKVILLDCRFHREMPGPESDILGKRQWQWLEDELRSSDAQVNLLVSGIQVLPRYHQFEKWANFPRARARLLALLGATDVPGLIIISGDRHIGEILRDTHTDLRYTLWEITSSGLTHSWSDCPQTPSPLRAGAIFTGKNFGRVLIDWEQGPSVELQIVEESGQVVERQRLYLDELRPRSSPLPPPERQPETWPVTLTRMLTLAAVLGAFLVVRRWAPG